MKKFLALLLSVVTAFAFSSVLTACTPTPPPAEPQGTAGLLFSYGAKGFTVVGIDETQIAEGTTNLVIPRTHKDSDGNTGNVVAIADNAFNANEYDNFPFTSISLPNTLQEIGLYAFAGVQVSTITLPASLTSIGCAAFQDAALTSVVFGNPNDWRYHENGEDGRQQDGILLSDPVVNINLADAAVAAQYLTTLDDDFIYANACLPGAGGVTPDPNPDYQPTGLAGLYLYK